MFELSLRVAPHPSAAFAALGQRPKVLDLARTVREIADLRISGEERAIVEPRLP